MLPCASICLALGLASLVPAAPAAEDDWPQFLGPTRNGVYHGAPLRESFPPGGPPVLWKRQVGQGWSGPVVAEGRLVIFHRVDDRETVECLAADSGKEAWKFEYATSYRDSYSDDYGPRATPAIAGGRVYTFGAEGVLHALDFQTGKKLWRVDAGSRFRASPGYFGFACSPLVEGHAVLLNVGGQPGAGIVAFEAASGEVLWQATDDAASYSSPVAATNGGKRQVLFFTRAGLTSLDPRTGAVNFRFPFRARIDQSVNAATPLVIDDLVFVSASYQVGAALLRVKDGSVEKLWASDEVLSNHYATSVHHQGLLFGLDGRQEYQPALRCVDLKKGEVRWSQDRFGGATLLLAGSRLVILSEKGELVLAAASPEGFRPEMRAPVLPGTVRAYPALVRGRLHARSRDTLVCLDLR